MQKPITTIYFMKARIQITVEKDLLKIIKDYAKKEGISVSKLVENHFKEITEKKSILDIMAELPKPKMNFPKDFDFKKAYYEENKKKYGF